MIKLISNGREIRIGQLADLDHFMDLAAHTAAQVLYWTGSAWLPVVEVV